jgi:hypothetical protein
MSDSIQINYASYRSKIGYDWIDIDDITFSWQ